MDGAVLFECAANLSDIKADEVSDLDVGDLALCLHLPEPAQGWSALVIEQQFEQTLRAD